mgnify:CR=1 FL=1
MAVTPRAYPLIGYPKAWTPGTNGPVSGEAIIAVINEEKDFAAFKGRLRGKFVLATPMREVAAHFEAPGHRYSDTELAELSRQPEGTGRGGRGRHAIPRRIRCPVGDTWPSRRSGGGGAAAGPGRAASAGGRPPSRPAPTASRIAAAAGSSVVLA